MKIATGFGRCIICLSGQPGSWEHIIPRSIGGTLQARVLCDRCNHTLGSELVSKLKGDPSIRLAMEQLRNRIPSLYARTYRKAPFTGKAMDGSVIRFSIAEGQGRVIAGRGAQDSVIRDTREAAEALGTKLTRLGLPPHEVSHWQRAFAELEDGVPLRVPSGDLFVKKPVPRLFPEFTGQHIDDRLHVLVALEFLALLEGNRIYNQALNPVRGYVSAGIPSTHVSVEHLAAGRTADTFHAIVVAPEESAVHVEVRLFRWIVFRVTFRGYRYSGPDSVYLEDLQSSRGLFSWTRAEARLGRWLTTA